MYKVAPTLIVEYTKLPEKWKNVCRDYWDFKNDCMIPLGRVFSDEPDEENEPSEFDRFMAEVLPRVDRNSFTEAYLNICW